MRTTKRSIWITHDGERRTAWGWSKHLGIEYRTVLRRYDAGVSIAATDRQSYEGLDETVLEYVGRLEVDCGTLRARVEAEYGMIHPRAWWRCLAKLAATGKLIRRPLGRNGAGYVYSRPKQQKQA